ncbi:Lrp/AsnC family transcriptional regulator [Roseovarius phycicola]|uniref:siroheme decarboxylase n=1 Tax=Roseovarius phycicola TaxID=3080976 RepID=A0ABZ2HBS4_9RHOB
MTLDDIDRQIINTLQGGFPLSSRPYAEFAQTLDLTEEELIARLRAMKDAGVITRFGPFLDAAAMGGAFCLCAIAAPEDQFEAVTEAVNTFPEVAHNYKRTHRLNMWFVLATETEAGITEAADAIEAATGHTVFRFPKLKEFFVGFRVAA